MNNLMFDWAELVNDIQRRKQAGESRQQILADLYYGVEAELDALGLQATGAQTLALATALYDSSLIRRPRLPALPALARRMRLSAATA